MTVVAPPLSVAPMIDRTHRHFRAFMRRLTRHSLLYTEMITTHALLRGDCERLLGFSELEGPIALQLGGDDPDDLARCAEMAQSYGYDELNLNVGCPSDRVQKGRFGACLMAEPEVVAQAVRAMRAGCDLTVTVKHRIGIDDLDRYEDMLNFVDVVAEAGPDRFTVHARKAWLQGLSPKQNREIPPLRHDEVVRLKAERPQLQIEINGGIRDLDTAASFIGAVDAVMIGRAAVDDPWIFADADRRFFGAENPASSRTEAVLQHLDYLREWQERGHALAFLAQPMLNLFHGRPRARAWRRFLSESLRCSGATVDDLKEVVASMEEDG